MKKYRPEYVPGEIIVCFKRDYQDPAFVSLFAKGMGDYKLKDSDEERHPLSEDGVFIFEIKPCDEERAIKDFERKKAYVDWARRRDLENERRLKAIDDLEGVLNEVSDELGDVLERSASRWNRVLDKFKNELEKKKII